MTETLVPLTTGEIHELIIAGISRVAIIEARKEPRAKDALHVASTKSALEKLTRIYAEQVPEPD